MVGKNEYSIRQIFASKSFKGLLDKPFESDTFAVENAQKPIVGIPHEIADEYWYDQSVKGNKRARWRSRPPLRASLDRAFRMSSLVGQG